MASFIEQLYTEILFWICVTAVLCAVIIGLLIAFGCITTICFCCRKKTPATQENALVQMQEVVVANVEPQVSTDMKPSVLSNELPPAYNDI